MKRTCTAIAALVFALVVDDPPYGQSRLEAIDAYDEQVQAIVDRGQLRSGELSENLAALGEQAIPAMCRAMLRDDEKFPSMYIRALDIIGDGSATPALVEFLEQRRPFTDENERTLVIQALRVLARIGNQLSDPILEELFRSGALHPRIRLYAAAALTKSNDDSLRREATARIFEEFTNRSEQTQDPSERVLESDFYEALIAVDNDASIQHLADALRGRPLRHNAQRIIEYFSSVDASAATSALLAVVDDGYNHEMNVRLSALEGVVGKIDKAAAYDKASTLFAEAVRDGWSEAEMNRAASLVERTAQLAR